MDKEQWLEMWQAVRKIEDRTKIIPPIQNGIRHHILLEVATIKRLIQSEVGQLE